MTTSIWRSRPCSKLFPVGQRHHLVEDFLQSLKSTCVITCCAVWLVFAAMQVQAVRFTDLRYFLSQFYDAFLDGILHDDGLVLWGVIMDGVRTTLLFNFVSVDVFHLE